MKKTIVYVDGFNLYNGIVSKGLLKFKWLDLLSLSKTLVDANHSIELVRYFTTRIKGNPNKHQRQASYIQALETFLQNKLIIKYGHFQLFDSECKNCLTTPIRCASCNYPVIKPNEKRTDVNIATDMLIDCFENKVDCLVLISGDSDYEEPLKAIKRVFPKKERIIAFPPMRRNPHLYNFCDSYLDITSLQIQNSQLPNPVVNPRNKNQYFKPSTW
jgi:uncharacterized LabA/DUF88 family protein